ncbi:MAG TPA: DUF4282 domain-containing protein [Jiangellaceae bacterium]
MTDTPPQPASPPQPTPTSQPTTPTFFTSLFDVRFSQYVTPTVIPVLYVLGMIGIAVGYLSYTIVAFSVSSTLGLLTLLILGPLFALLALIWLRVTLEFYLSLVRLSGDFRDWREEWRLRH